MEIVTNDQIYHKWKPIEGLPDAAHEWGDVRYADAVKE